MNVGRKIRILRVQKGINQQQLADLINKTRTLISHIEITSKVNYYTLLEISNALDVPISYFLEDNDNSLEEPREDYKTQLEKTEKLEREIELLKEIVSNQKDLIDELKKRLN